MCEYSHISKTSPFPFFFMKNLSLFRRTFALLCAATTLGCAAHAAPKLAVKESLPAANNTMAVRSKKATALIFLARDCPISNAYAPEMTRLYNEFSPRGVAFRFVYEDTQNLAQAKAHARQYRLRGAISVDEKASLAKRTGARVTPEAVVVMPNGRIVYRGRISDLFADYGKRRRIATRHDLRDALQNALRSGASTRLVITKAVGCFIAMN